MSSIIYCAEEARVACQRHLLELREVARSSRTVGVMLNLTVIGA